MELKASITYKCEHCGGIMHERYSSNHNISFDGAIVLEATMKLYCPACETANRDLIRDLYNALPWNIRQNFDHPILDQIEREILYKQQKSICIMGVAV